MGVGGWVGAMSAVGARASRCAWRLHAARVHGGCMQHVCMEGKGMYQAGSMAARQGMASDRSERHSIIIVSSAQGVSPLQMNYACNKSSGAQASRRCGAVQGATRTSCTADMVRYPAGMARCTADYGSSGSNGSNM